MLKRNKNTYTAKHVFDSRIPEDFSKQMKIYITIIQHFKGWIIKTETDAFDDNGMLP